MTTLRIVSAGCLALLAACGGSSDRVTQSSAMVTEASDGGAVVSTADLLTKAHDTARAPDPADSTIVYQVDDGPVQVLDSSKFLLSMPVAEIDSAAASLDSGFIEISSSSPDISFSMSPTPAPLTAGSIVQCGDQAAKAKIALPGLPAPSAVTDGTFTVTSTRGLEQLSPESMGYLPTRYITEGTFDAHVRDANGGQHTVRFAFSYYSTPL